MNSKKKRISLVVSFVLAFIFVYAIGNVNAYALNDNEEMRATWLTTVWNNDWPLTSDYNNPERQKITLKENLDFIKNQNLNTVFFQVRTMGDAFYPSNYAPWSRFLTGTLGKNPGYDPLKLAVNEAHARGLEIHPWFNPFRISTDGDNFDKQGYINSLPNGSALKNNPQWIVQYGNYHCLDIGIPEARKYVIDSITEVVKNYNIDGIHLDDYFYPYPKDNIVFPDDETFNKYGQGYSNKEDWRRDNINKFVKDLNSSIKSEKPQVKFGISPFGIWRNGSSVGGSNTNGLSSYDAIYVDSKKWVQEEWLDYIVPQIYWAFDTKVAPYGELVDWWSKQVEGKKVHLYIGQATYKINDQFGSDEIINQIKYNRNNKNVKGSSFFSLRDLKDNKDGILEKLKTVYNTKADVPNMNWLNGNGWVQRGGIWYFYNSDGSMAKDWQYINGTWYYFNNNGVMTTGWVKINNTWYYLDSNGAMKTGWINLNGTWYYLDSNGSMRTDWINLNGNWYYLDSSGAMRTGWTNVNGVWYYLESTGVMKTGWVKLDKSWYYLDGSGAMKTGWLQLGKDWYYLKEDGKMVTGWFTVDGKNYYFNDSGLLL